MPKHELPPGNTANLPKSNLPESFNPTNLTVEELLLYISSSGDQPGQFGKLPGRPAWNEGETQEIPQNLETDDNA